ncbi:hypothetical protein RchiOBHm_Chr1g0359141 [Rosa chinensis]|uniref:Uncharacterized protein n=1 Tax=Rosa chinensis TaxID=74649 RepID=A0A2P6SIB4_ROSCH|nr:hypothetical protein RchiOBHm_Chr1g0359141 [Rosa chinensis]
MLMIDYIEDNAIFKCGGRDLHFYLESYIEKYKKIEKCQKFKNFRCFCFCFES